MTPPDPAPLTQPDIDLRQSLISGFASAPAPAAFAAGASLAMAAPSPQPTSSQITQRLADFINGLPAFGSSYVDFMLRYNGIVAAAAAATTRDQVISRIGTKDKHGTTYFIGPQESYLEAFYSSGVVVDDSTAAAEQVFKGAISTALPNGFTWWPRFQDLLLKDALHRAAPEIAYKPGNLGSDLAKLNAELFTSANLALFQQQTLRLGYIQTKQAVAGLSADPAQARTCLLAAMRSPLFMATLNLQMQQQGSDAPFICAWLLYNAWCLLAVLGFDYPTIDSDIVTLQAAGLRIPYDASPTVWHSSTTFWFAPLAIGYAEMVKSCPNLTAALPQETVVNGTVTGNSMVTHGLAESYLVWYQQYLSSKH